MSRFGYFMLTYLIALCLGIFSLFVVRRIPLVSLA